MAWIWGQGTKPTVPSFHDRFGLRGAMITSVDLLAGIASYIGWDRLHVPGLTSYHDTDYTAQGKATVKALKDYDIVCCHVEAPDEASHQADWQTKLASIEAIDEHVVGPIAKGLEAYGDPASDTEAEGWRLLVLPDHYTLVSTRKHDATPVPFLLAGAWVKSMVQRAFNEPSANQSDLDIADGHELMEYFLRGGLANVRGTRKRS
jgi:2,3-bisphosphoglycerate-independent phosphoglycerate mutase